MLSLEAMQMMNNGGQLKTDLASLHGQAATLAALVTISPGLSLGYLARLPRSVLEVSKKMLTESRRDITVASSEKEAGWLLLSSLLNSMPKEADAFTGNPDVIKQHEDLKSTLTLHSQTIEENFMVLEASRISSRESESTRKARLLSPRCNNSLKRAQQKLEEVAFIAHQEEEHARVAASADLPA